VPKILLLGAGGLLGSAFGSALEVQGVKRVGRDALDVRRPEAIARLIADADCDWVINCAADTDVEAAEDDPLPAYAANAILPQMLASACRAHGALLVHVSSTGCYGIAKATPYTEADIPEPTTVHHRSKIAGEAAIRAAHGRHLIVRTGWLFGGSPANPKNFVWRRLLEARGAAWLTSDPHQVGCPTYVGDAAGQILAMAGAGCEGTFNVVSEGVASRLDYVSRIVAASGLPCEVRPSTRPFTRKARVSNNEAAVNFYLRAIGMDNMPSWEAGVDVFTRELTSTPAWRALDAGQANRQSGVR